MYSTRDTELTNEYISVQLGKKVLHDKCNFLIHHGTSSFELSISSDATIADLHNSVWTDVNSQVASRIDLLPGHRFVCLESSNKSQLIDYVLLKPKEKLSIFRKNEIFKTYTTDHDEESLKPSVADFIFMKCLGQGGSASVYLVRRKKNGKMYALKQVDKDYFIEFKRMQQILREKKILSEIVNDHPFVALLHASFESERHLNFLIEYYPGGELFLHLQRRRFTQHEAKLYFSEVLLAFQYLHKNRIIYRDLKVIGQVMQPENIMIDWEGHTKLTDFGLCKMNLTREEHTHSFCGSLEYMAPEVKENQGYNYSVDFYTLGAFLYEMIVGVPPYYNNQPLYFPQKVSKSMMELVKGLIDKDLDKRVNSFSVVKSTAWLSGVNWADVYNRRYEMPIKLCIYDTYIHDEFTKVKVDSMNLMREEKFDRLFDMFYYNRDQPSRSSQFTHDQSNKLLSPDAFRKSKGKNNSKSRKSNKSKEKQRDSIGMTKTKKSSSRDRSQDKGSRKGTSKPLHPGHANLHIPMLHSHSNPMLETISKLPRVFSPVGQRVDPKKFLFRN